MTRFIVAIALMLGLVAPAWADYDAVPTNFQCNQSGVIKPTQAEACQYGYGGAKFPVAGGVQASDPIGTYPGPYKCNYYYKSDKSDTPTPASCTNSWSCPYGGTLGGSTGRTCVGANGPATCVKGPAGSMTLTSAYATGPSYGSGLAIKVVPDNAFKPTLTGGLATVSYCDAGCLVTPSGVPQDIGIEQTPSGNGYYRVLLKGVPMYRTGGQCTVSGNSAPTDSGTTLPDPNVPPPPPSTPNTAANGECPKGMTPLGKDPSGMTICTSQTKAPGAAAPTNTVTGPATTTNNSDGSTTTTQSTTTTNADGSTSTVTKVTTTAPDGTTSTKTNTSTSNTPSGAAGVQDRPQDQSDFCKLHTELNACKNSQVLGTCGDISCTGDAIQCETLRAASKLQCDQQKNQDDIKASSQYALGKAVAEGNDPMAGKLPSTSNASTVNVPTSLDQSGWLGAGAGLSDASFTFRGRTFAIPFSKANQYLVAFRYAMMVVALLVSFRLVSGAVLKE